MLRSGLQGLSVTLRRRAAKDLVFGAEARKEMLTGRRPPLRPFPELSLSGRRRFFLRRARDSHVTVT